MSRVSIIAIGNELVSGKLVDTNSAYIAGRLRTIGVGEVSIRLVADSLEAITRAISQEKDWADAIITTGGLGPTSDDGTRQAIAEAASAELEIDQSSLAKLEQYCAQRNRPLNENNRRQVFFPSGSEVITNPIGTANAFITPIPQTSSSAVPLFALPGVPQEALLLCDEEVTPRLVERLSNLQPTELLALRCFGLSESHIGEQIEACNLPPAIEVAYRPQFPEILLHLSTTTSATAATELQDVALRVSQALGEEFIISRSEAQNLPSVVSELLISNGLSLAAAESCSGGLLAHELVSLSGSSAFFRGSVVSYSNEAKQKFLGVGAEALDMQGAVSEEVALEMAEGVRQRTNASLAISITGVAGPNGGTEEKPVGLVWIGFSAEGVRRAFRLQLPWDRDFVRRYSVFRALDIVRRHVLGHSLS